MQNPTKIIIIEIPNGVDAVDAVNVEAIPLKNKFTWIISCTCFFFKSMSGQGEGSFGQYKLDINEYK